MKILILKLSSMGDIIHTLPALTDIASKIPEVSFDWVIEENFVEIPSWHPAVKKVIPIGLRRWRKAPLKSVFSGEIFRFIRDLRTQKYDLVIDVQGLYKSALIGCLARKIRFAGLDKFSAKEAGASFFYMTKIFVPKGIHAITRIRMLCAKILGYDLSEDALKLPSYHLLLNQQALNVERPYVIFLHGTTWESKHWPESYWISLAQKILDHAWDVYLPWGNEIEKDRAHRITTATSVSKGSIKVLEKLSLSTLALLLKQAIYVVGVDTGLAHLAAALECPSLILFGPTDVSLTGPLSAAQISLQSHFICSPCFEKQCRYPLKDQFKVQPPCFAELSPERVWDQMRRQSINFDSDGNDANKHPFD